ncbi:MAG TPA: LapA family protein [Actinospica sp.]|nr:LapA family protein [Actinospica sp.]
MSESDERDPAQLTVPDPTPEQPPGPDTAPPSLPPAPAPAAPEPGPVPIPQHSRLSAVWVLLAAGAVVLILLLVFILQNSQHVEVHIYGGHWNAPLGVALLMAAALGVLLVVIPVTARILQLRRAMKSGKRGSRR